MLIGELDALTAAPLPQTLATLPDVGTLVTWLRFIDTHAAGILELTLQRRRPEGRLLIVEDTAPLLRKVWEVCGLDPTFRAAEHRNLYPRDATSRRSGRPSRPLGMLG
jgi:anti-anti-sigma regulatory factor